MIGYMRPYRKMFSLEDWKTYRSIYCGLCNAMRREHGLKSIIFLSYEMTSLLYLILSLTEEEPALHLAPCSLTPFIWERQYGKCQNSFVCASAASLLVANYEAEDNLLDEGKLKNKIILGYTEWNARPIMNRYIEFSQKLRKIYNEFQTVEKAASERPHVDYISYLANLSGEISAVIAQYAVESERLTCQNEVYSFFYYWGEWIYLMDAVDDYYNDRQRGKFNPLFLFSSEPCDRAEQLLINYETYAAEWLLEIPVRRWREGIETLFLAQLPKRRENVVGKMRRGE